MKRYISYISTLYIQNHKFYVVYVNSTPHIYAYKLLQPAHTIILIIIIMYLLVNVKTA